MESAYDTRSGRSRSSGRFDNAGAPDGIRIERGVRGLRITRSWFTGSAHVMVGWVVVWFGLVSFFRSLGNQPFGWLDLVLAYPGLVMAYAAIAHYVNHTMIDVTPSRLVVQHAPVPWLGGKNFATRDIDRVCGETKKVHAKGHTYDARRVMVVRLDGRKKRLLSGLELSESQMDFVVEAINGYLQAMPRTRGPLGRASQSPARSEANDETAERRSAR